MKNVKSITCHCGRVVPCFDFTAHSNAKAAGLIEEV